LREEQAQRRCRLRHRLRHHPSNTKRIVATNRITHRFDRIRRHPAATTTAKKIAEAYREDQQDHARERIPILQEETKAKSECEQDHP
jgi:hypothetical protein